MTDPKQPSDSIPSPAQPPVAQPNPEAQNIIRESE